MKSPRALMLMPILAALLSGCQTTNVVGSCPALPPPPEAATDALQAAKNSAVDTWVDTLDRHYQKLDACRAK